MGLITRDLVTTLVASAPGTALRRAQGSFSSLNRRHFKGAPNAPAPTTTADLDGPDSIGWLV